jgi:hypothetical protein
VGAALRNDDLVAELAQVVADDLLQIPLVLHHQDARHVMDF